MQVMKSRKLRQTVEAALSGMRRVDCVRMVEDERPRFFVVGTGHRLPVEREVTPSVARVCCKSSRAVTSGAVTAGFADHVVWRDRLLAALRAMNLRCAA